MALPPAGIFTSPTTTNGEAKQAQDDMLEALRIAGIPVATAAGTADALTTTFSPALVLATAPRVAVILAAANATSAPTLTDGAGTATVITKRGGVALAVGDLPGAGAVADLKYSATPPRWELLNPASASIPSGSVTYAMLQDVSATARLLGRKTAGAGPPEEISLSQALDLIGTAAWGDILYRNASGWALLPAATAGKVLRTGGAGADPAWADPASAQDVWAYNAMLLMGLRLEINSAISTGAMLDGEVWGFLTDELATKTNATYEASGDYYSCEGSSVAIAQGTGTAVGNMTVSGGLAAAFDGTTSQTAGACANDNSAAAYIGKDWGSGNSRTITGIDMFGSNNTGFLGTASSFVYVVKGSNSAPSYGGGTTLYTSGTITDANALQITQLTGFVTATAYRYHWVEFLGYTNDCYVAELKFYETNTATNMTLIPTAVSAVAAPSDSRLVLLHKDVSGSYALNTDLTAEVSRDNGTTYSTITLADEGVYDASAGWRILAGTVAVSGQPSGASMLWRIKTFNTKGQRVKGVAMMWS